jgi:hypothetical protein
MIIAQADWAAQTINRAPTIVSLFILASTCLDATHTPTTTQRDNATSGRKSEQP